MSGNEIELSLVAKPHAVLAVRGCFSDVDGPHRQAQQLLTAVVDPNPIPIASIRIRISSVRGVDCDAKHWRRKLPAWASDDGIGGASPSRTNAGFRCKGL